MGKSHTDILRLQQKQAEFTPAERAAIDTLIVEPDTADANELRTALRELGYGSVHVDPDHVRALKTFQERNFTHIIFSARATTMEAAAFIEAVRTGDPDSICIPTSYDPQIDDVFLLLQKGARWFLVKPYTAANIDDCMLQATKGEGFSETLLFAEDRNVAFSALLAANIDSAARAAKDARKYDSAKQEEAGIMKRLRATAKLATVFADTSGGSEKNLASSILDFFSSLSIEPASRLGRLRKKLRKKREDRFDE